MGGKRRRGYSSCCLVFCARLAHGSRTLAKSSLAPLPTSQPAWFLTAVLSPVSFWTISSSSRFNYILLIYCVCPLAHVPRPQRVWGGGEGGVRGQLQESVLSSHSVDSRDQTDVFQAWQLGTFIRGNISPTLECVLMTVQRAPGTHLGVGAPLLGC